MKIPLELTRERLFKSGFIRCKKLRFSGPIRFLIDTGSPTSFIGTSDLLRLRVPTTHIKFDKPTIIGGNKIGLGDLHEITISFKGIDDNLEKIDLTNFGVCNLLWKGKKKTKDFQDVPSILGMDFLYMSELKLVVDAINNTAFFEKN